MRVSLDGVPLGSGTSVVVNPMMLAWFGDGAHVLRVEVGGERDRRTIRLSPCRLAVQLAYHRNGASELTVSTRAGMSRLIAVFSGHLRLDRSRPILGRLTYQSAGHSARSFYLKRARTRSGGVNASVTGTSIRISGLPPQVGVITLHLSSGALIGTGGVTVRVRVLGSGRAITATARTQTRP